MEIMLFGTSALSVMKPFNTEQKTRIVKFYIKHGSAVLTQRQYRRHFKVREAPTIRTIQRLTDKFLAEGSISNQNAGKLVGKNIPQSGGHTEGRGACRSDTENAGAAPRVSGEGLSKSSSHRILKKDLALSALKFRVSQKLSAADFEQRQQFCECFLEKCTNNPNSLSCVWWSDVAHFHLNGQGNRQNYRIWAERPSEEALEAPLYSPKVAVWCALSAQGIIATFFFF